MHELMPYVEHFGAGLVFAASGAVASRWCEHLWHRVAVALGMVAVETVVVVTLVG